MKKKDFSVSISGKTEVPKMCYVCGEDDSRILNKFEKHHVFAKANSDELIWLCPNCHGKITSKQNSVSPAKRKNNLAFQLLTQGELLVTVGKEQIKIAERLLQDGQIIS